MLYNIYHEYDVDGGFGDSVTKTDVIATVDSTPEEINAFIEEWNKPRIYARPYAELWEHTIYAKPVQVTVKLSEFEPYNPKYKTEPYYDETEQSDDD